MVTSTNDVIISQQDQKDAAKKARLERIRYTKRMSWRRKQAREKKFLNELTTKHAQMSTKNTKLVNENKKIKLIIEHMRDPNGRKLLSIEMNKTLGTVSSSPTFLDATTTAEKNNDRNHNNRDETQQGSNVTYLQQAAHAQALHACQNEWQNVYHHQQLAQESVKRNNIPIEDITQNIRNISTDQLFLELNSQQQIMHAMGLPLPRAVNGAPFSCLPPLVPATNAYNFTNHNRYHSYLQKLASSTSSLAYPPFHWTTSGYPLSLVENSITATTKEPSVSLPFPKCMDTIQNTKNDIMQHELQLRSIGKNMLRERILDRLNKNT